MIRGRFKDNLNMGFKLDRVFFLLTCAYLVGVLCWLTIQYLKPPVNSQSAIAANEQEPNKISDTQFISYLLRSLAEIDAQTPTTPAPTNINPTNLNVATTTQELGQVVQMSQQPLPSPPQLSNNTVIAANSNSERIPIPPPPPTAQSLPQLSTVPVFEPQNNAPASNLPLPDNGATQTAVAPQNNALVGLLESGDRSAALFNIDGITQRVYLGESIGETGWILFSIANEQAVINRNGQIRYIYVGDQF